VRPIGSRRSSFRRSADPRSRPRLARTRRLHAGGLGQSYHRGHRGRPTRRPPHRRRVSRNSSRAGRFNSRWGRQSRIDGEVSGPGCFTCNIWRMSWPLPRVRTGRAPFVGRSSVNLARHAWDVGRAPAIPTIRSCGWESFDPPEILGLLAASCPRPSRRSSEASLTVAHP
jgi:hypothetical protein